MLQGGHIHEVGDLERTKIASIQNGSKGQFMVKACVHSSGVVVRGFQVATLPILQRKVR
jgi:hypothetical protein